MEFTDHKDFKDIFSKFERILVTGPQRSGSKLIANIISLDTGYRLVRHKQMDLPSGIKTFRKKKNIVLHHPSFVAFLKDIEDEHTAIVYCWRRLKDILDSEYKWKWLKYYPLELGYLKSQGYIRKIGEKMNPAKIKNKVWKNTLESTLQNTFTVRYEDLESHPLWVSKEARDRFTDINQISEYGDIYRITEETINRKIGK